MKNQTTISQNRNYGIDLLKITAMFFIVCWHLIIHGQALQFANEHITFAVQSFCVLGVNCFALTSGYVLSDITYKPHRIIVYWLQVVFYSAIIVIYFAILYSTTYAYIKSILFLTDFRNCRRNCCGKPSVLRLSGCLPSVFRSRYHGQFVRVSVR